MSEGTSLTLRGYFEKHRDQIAMALPKHLNPDRMIRLVMTSFSQNSALKKCTPESVFGAIIMASQMGLEIGVNGQGYLVPYKDTCTFVPGWKGLVDLVSRAGRASVWTGAVFEGDEFDYQLGDKPFVKHRPAGEDDPKLLTHAYAVGRVNGSDWPVIEVWTNERIRKHFAKFNKVGERHYAWKNWEMYGRKVPLLQVLKYMPSSIELQNAVSASNAFESGQTYTMNPAGYVDVSGGEEQAGGAEERQTGNAGLRRAVGRPRKDAETDPGAGNGVPPALEHDPGEQADFSEQRQAEPERVAPARQEKAAGRAAPPSFGNAE